MLDCIAWSKAALWPDVLHTQQHSLLKLLQVAEKNIYDRMLSTLTSPRSPTSPVSPQTQPRSERKKVRFRETDDFPEDSPAATTQMPGARSHCTTPLQGPSPRVRRKLLDGEATVPASPSSSATANALSSLPSWQSTMPQPSPHPKQSTAAKPTRSYVPEHVRRPEAYTCYTLDFPVLVGSGNDGHSASSAASAASAAMEYFNSGNTAAAPASAATPCDPEPGAVQFVFRASRDECKSREPCQLASGIAVCPDVEREGHAHAAQRAVAGTDSDMEDVIEGVDAAEVVQGVEGAPPSDFGGAMLPGDQHSALVAGLTGGESAQTSATAAVFVGKSWRRGGRRMRARTKHTD